MKRKGFWILFVLGVAVLGMSSASASAASPSIQKCGEELRGLIHGPEEERDKYIDYLYAGFLFEKGCVSKPTMPKKVKKADKTAPVCSKVARSMAKDLQPFYRDYKKTNQAFLKVLRRSQKLSRKLEREWQSLYPFATDAQFARYYRIERRIKRTLKRMQPRLNRLEDRTQRIRFQHRFEIYTVWVEGAVWGCHDRDYGPVIGPVEELMFRNSEAFDEAVFNVFWINK